MLFHWNRFTFLARDISESFFKMSLTKKVKSLQQWHWVELKQAQNDDNDVPE